MKNSSDYHCFLFFLLFLTISHAQAQQPAGARYAGMGYCSALSSDVFSVANNPSGLARVKQASIACYYDHTLNMKELSQRVFVVATPIAKGKVASIKVSSSGFDLYRNTAISGAFAMQLAKDVRAGVTIDYLDFFFGQEYGHHTRLTNSIGLQTDLSEKVSVGIYSFNPFAFKIKPLQNEVLSTSVKAGLRYHSQNVAVQCETEKWRNQPYQLRFGVEYNPVPAIFIRGGTALNPAMSSIGCGYIFKQLTGDFALTWQRYAGIFPQISFKYGLVGRKN